MVAREGGLEAGFMKLVNGLYDPESAVFWPDSAILRRGVTLVSWANQRHGRRLRP
jgi:hypothetical protein